MKYRLSATIFMLCLCASCAPRDYFLSTSLATNDTSNSGPCDENRTNAIICANSAVDLYASNGTAFRKLQPGQLVCQTNTTTPSGSKFVSLPETPEVHGYIAQPKLRICALDRSKYSQHELNMFKVGVVDLGLFLNPGETRVTLAYATPFNFTKTNHYGDAKKCFLRPNVAVKVAKAARSLLSAGWRLVMLDCGRPVEVQASLYAAVNQDRTKAAPPGESKHNFGCAVDVTIEPKNDTTISDDDIINSKTRELMGTTFDDFANANLIPTAAAVNAEARAHRDLLVKVMKDADLENYAGEWWHFNGDANYKQYPLIKMASDN